MRQQSTMGGTKESKNHRKGPYRTNNEDKEHYIKVYKI